MGADQVCNGIAIDLPKFSAFHHVQKIKKIETEGEKRALVKHGVDKIIILKWDLKRNVMTEC